MVRTGSEHTKHICAALFTSQEIFGRYRRSIHLIFSQHIPARPGFLTCLPPLLYVPLAIPHVYLLFLYFFLVYSHVCVLTLSPLLCGDTLQLFPSPICQASGLRHCSLVPTKGSKDSALPQFQFGRSVPASLGSGYMSHVSISQLELPGSKDLMAY
jgi:hypothetical protein